MATFSDGEILSQLRRFRHCQNIGLHSVSSTILSSLQAKSDTLSSIISDDTYLYCTIWFESQKDKRRPLITSGITTATSTMLWNVEHMSTQLYELHNLIHDVDKQDEIIHIKVHLSSQLSNKDFNQLQRRINRECRILQHDPVQSEINMSVISSQAVNCDGDEELSTIDEHSMETSIQHHTYDQSQSDDCNECYYDSTHQQRRRSMEAVYTPSFRFKKMRKSVPIHHQIPFKVVSPQDNGNDVDHTSSSRIIHHSSPPSPFDWVITRDGREFDMGSLHPTTHSSSLALDGTEIHPLDHGNAVDGQHATFTHFEEYPSLDPCILSTTFSARQLRPMHPQFINILGQCPINMRFIFFTASQPLTLLPDVFFLEHLSSLKYAMRLSDLRRFVSMNIDAFQDVFSQILDIPRYHHHGHDHDHNHHNQYPHANTIDPQGNNSDTINHTFSSPSPSPSPSSSSPSTTTPPLPLTAAATPSPPLAKKEGHSIDTINHHGILDNDDDSHPTPHQSTIAFTDTQPSLVEPLIVDEKSLTHTPTRQRSGEPITSPHSSHKTTSSSTSSSTSSTPRLSSTSTTSRSSTSSLVPSPSSLSLTIHQNATTETTNLTTPLNASMAATRDIIFRLEVEQILETLITDAYQKRPTHRHTTIATPGGITPLSIQANATPGHARQRDSMVISEKTHSMRLGGGGDHGGGVRNPPITSPSHISNHKSYYNHPFSLGSGARPTDINKKTTTTTSHFTSPLSQHQHPSGGRVNGTPQSIDTDPIMPSSRTPPLPAFKGSPVHESDELFLITPSSQIEGFNLISKSGDHPDHNDGGNDGPGPGPGHVPSHSSGTQDSQPISTTAPSSTPSSTQSITIRAQRQPQRTKLFDYQNQRLYSSLSILDQNTTTTSVPSHHTAMPPHSPTGTGGGGGGISNSAVFQPSSSNAASAIPFPPSTPQHTQRNPRSSAFTTPHGQPPLGRTDHHQHNQVFSRKFQKIFVGGGGGSGGGEGSLINSMSLTVPVPGHITPQSPGHPSHLIKHHSALSPIPSGDNSSSYPCSPSWNLTQQQHGLHPHPHSHLNNNASGNNLMGGNTYLPIPLNTSGGGMHHTYHPSSSSSSSFSIPFHSSLPTTIPPSSNNTTYSLYYDLLYQRMVVLHQLQVLNPFWFEALSMACVTGIPSQRPSPAFNPSTPSASHHTHAMSYQSTSTPMSLPPTTGKGRHATTNAASHYTPTTTPSSTPGTGARRNPQKSQLQPSNITANPSTHHVVGGSGNRATTGAAGTYFLDRNTLLLLTHYIPHQAYRYGHLNTFHYHPLEADYTFHEQMMSNRHHLEYTSTASASITSQLRSSSPSSSPSSSSSSSPPPPRTNTSTTTHIAPGQPWEYSPLHDYYYCCYTLHEPPVFNPFGLRGRDRRQGRIQAVLDVGSDIKLSTTILQHKLRAHHLQCDIDKEYLAVGALIANTHRSYAQVQQSIMMVKHHLELQSTQREEHQHKDQERRQHQHQHHHQYYINAKDTQDDTHTTPTNFTMTPYEYAHTLRIQQQHMRHLAILRRQIAIRKQYVEARQRFISHRRYMLKQLECQVILSSLALHKTFNLFHSQKHTYFSQLNASLVHHTRIMNFRRSQLFASVHSMFTIISSPSDDCRQLLLGMYPYGGIPLSQQQQQQQQQSHQHLRGANSRGNTFIESSNTHHLTYETILKTYDKLPIKLQQRQQLLMEKFMEFCYVFGHKVYSINHIPLLLSKVILSQPAASTISALNRSSLIQGHTLKDTSSSTSSTSTATITTYSGSNTQSDRLQIQNTQPSTTIISTYDSSPSISSLSASSQMTFHRRSFYHAYQCSLLQHTSVGLSFVMMILQLFGKYLTRDFRFHIFYHGSRSFLVDDALWTFPHLQRQQTAHATKASGSLQGNGASRQQQQQHHHHQSSSSMSYYTYTSARQLNKQWVKSIVSQQPLLSALTSMSPPPSPSSSSSSSSSSNHEHDQFVALLDVIHYLNFNLLQLIAHTTPSLQVSPSPPATAPASSPSPHPNQHSFSRQTSMDDDDFGSFEQVPHPHSFQQSQSQSKLQLQLQHQSNSNQTQSSIQSPSSPSSSSSNNALPSSPSIAMSINGFLGSDDSNDDRPPSSFYPQQPSKHLSTINDPNAIPLLRDSIMYNGYHGVAQLYSCYFNHKRSQQASQFKTNPVYMLENLLLLFSQHSPM